MKRLREKVIPVPANEQKLEPSSDPKAPFDVVLISRTVRIGEPGRASEILEYRYRQIPKGSPWLPVEIHSVEPSAPED
jgi:hypothetical protein